MPWQKCCQHPTRHENSTVVAKGNTSVSLELAKFLQNQYDLSGGYIRWLCANCRSLETKTMRSYRSTEEAEDQSSSNNESSSENSSNDDDEEDDYEGQCEMDDDESNKSTEDDDDGPEPMDDDSVNGEDDLVFQQDQAFENLTNIFQLLNISPIHDK
ncbi:unnamed protein product [Rotaria sp. Silwood2]|nr:unnamed protein product [Rotaria sp. Silwood2]CAF4573757.1 unnamed protein product [Rotaria sp. Silwood2]